VPPATVDQAVADVRVIARRVNANLHELDDDPRVTLVRHSPLTGETARRWRDATMVILDLWERATHLTALVERAEWLSRRARRSKGEDDELRRLLHGPAIELVARDEVPIERRGLLESARVRSSLTWEEFAARMDEEYRGVVDLVVEISTAWEQMVRVRGLRPILDECRLLTAHLGDHADPRDLDPIADLDARLGQLIVRLAEDPLGVPGGQPDELVADVQRLFDDLHTALTLGDDLADRLDDMGTIGSMLAARVDEASRARSHARSRIARLELPEVPDTEEFVTRLDELRTSGDTTRPRELAAALAKWRDDVEAVRQVLDAIIDAAHRAIAERDELRGLLAASGAMAAGLGRAEHPDVLATHEAAHDELYNAPCDLERARALVLAAHSAARQEERS